jgi:NAD-dependent deacetylase
MALAAALLERFAAARALVVFTGAGVSQESGLDVFRGPGGSWERFRPEDLATPEAFARDPARVWRWYRERFAAMRAAEPNPAHRTIARWDGVFASSLVVTQNVDGLHQRAGARDVVELHGGLRDSFCAGCGRRRPTAEILDGLAESEPPRPCPCGSRFRPAVVWFGEALPARAVERAVEAARRADAFLVVGTSATVWPAAGLIEVAADAGALVIEVNREPSALSDRADATLLGAAGEILPALDRELEAWRSRS